MAYKQALLVCLSLRGEIHRDTANARLRLGSVLNDGEEFDDAEEELRKVLSIREALQSTDDLRTAEVCSLLGTVLIEQNKFEEALSLHVRALEIQKQLLDKDDPLIIESIEVIDKLNYLK